MNTEEKKRVMEAFLNGEEIEVLGKGYSEWLPLKNSNPIWNWQDYNYRIKPKSKKRLKKTNGAETLRFSICLKKH